jgi:hypothetical protein
MKTFTIKGGRALIATSFMALLGTGCGGGNDASQTNTPPSPAAQQSAQPPATQEPMLVRGTVASVTAAQLVIKADTGAVTLKVTHPIHVYQQEAGKLADVKDSTFIGVTTVKQPDGSERATEIHIFPEALRGTGEGSRMMTPRPNAAASRMTNGNVSASRMSNGSVSRSNGSTMVVSYAGGSQTVTVPPNTPVTEIRAVPTTLAPGDTVAVLATRAADGTLSTDKAFIASRK